MTGANNHTNPWTLARAKEFIDRYQSTETKKLAQELGKSVKAIGALAHKSYRYFPQLRNGNSKYKKHVIPAHYMEKHFNRDMTHREIAEVFGVKYTTVQKTGSYYHHQGYDVKLNPYVPPHPEGAIVTTKKDGTRQKVNGVWVRIKKEKPAPTPKQAAKRAQSHEYRERQKVLRKLEIDARAAILRGKKEEAEKKRQERDRIKAETRAAAQAKRDAKAQQKAAMQASKQKKLLAERRKVQAAKKALQVERAAKAEQERIKRQALRQQKQRKPEIVQRKVSHDTNPEKFVIKASTGLPKVKVARNTWLEQRVGETEQDTIDRYYRVFSKSAA